MWKKYRNVLLNKNDAPLVSQIRLHAQIVALRLHCARIALSAPPNNAIVRGMPRFLDWYPYVPSRPRPLFREKGGTATRPGAFGPSGCSALCYMELKNVSLVFARCWGECLPGARLARYLCIKYLISSPKAILTLGSPPSRPH